MWERVDSPLDNWLVLFSTTNPDFGIQEATYCLWGSQPGPPRSPGGPLKSVLLLLLANWVEEKGHKKPSNVDQPPFYFHHISQRPSDRYTWLVFRFLQIRKVQLENHSLVKLHNHSSSPPSSSGFGFDNQEQDGP